MNDLISVIVPVFNSERYISECLISLTGQTYGNIEIICVDDGSSDGSVSVIRKFAEKDKRIKLYINPCNKGVSFSRNFAISKANGDWLAFVDSDDFCADTYLQNLIYAVKQHENGFVFSSLYFFNDGDNDYTVDKINKRYSDLYADKKVSRTISIRKFLTDTKAYHPFALGCLFRRDVITEKDVLFPADCSFSEDVCFMIKYASFFTNVYEYCPQGYFYRKRADSLSARFDREACAVNNVIKRSGIFIGFEDVERYLSTNNPEKLRYFRAFMTFDSSNILFHMKTCGYHNADIEAEIKKRLMLKYCLIYASSSHFLTYGLLVLSMKLFPKLTGFIYQALHRQS